MLKIRNVKLEDLPNLIDIEHLCFTKEEAATKEAFEKRIHFISDSFFVAEEKDVIVGLVNGPVIDRAYITDDLFSDIKENPVSGGHQSILGLAVSPYFQKRGVASALLAHIETEASAKKRETMTLTCKADLIHFYENHGYLNNGVSSSHHGGVIWYNMSKKLV
ncbi:GNAT family N-acetyltransferase [Bacillus sp. ISL-40]|uniref:GNAT family N-acetyltransferase n=1 Tax=unclassified Bacillus (in: firmicutes) TaxID=185979 RepID=UPI001BE80C95|nr:MULTISPECIES: N-acetyltransferase [unclassified Bacillus (in: firmicutes)]MBT2699125.1 GNAT family N-acetyltransferase [Bacillus sp. ISL-40]MBT2724873.1 GNAT family N-acetyltransferase [Bacillus sp. ISL-46]MBT2739420.1 GNAT family N-acetyltransferase [Bacillus sp. ISL-77]